MKVDKEMTPLENPKGYSKIADVDMGSVSLTKSKSEITMGKVGIFSTSKVENPSQDKSMDDLTMLKSVKQEANVKMEISEPKQRRKSKRRSKKSVFIEFNQASFELKVLVEKTKGEKVKTKVHKQTILKPEKKEKSKSTDRKTPKRNLKLKTKRNSSLIKNLSKKVKSKVKKAPVKKSVKVEEPKSTKRVLLKTMVVKPPKPRTLRSGNGLTKEGKTSKTK